MAVRTVLELGDPFLRLRAEPVPERAFGSADLCDLIDDLRDTMATFDGAGLAAPQTGVGLRVLIYGRGVIGPRQQARLHRLGDTVQLAIAFPAKPRRHRPVNPHAASNALALQHRDIAKTVTGNISRRTGHPKEDLEQFAMLGTIQAARRY